MTLNQSIDVSTRGQGDVHDLTGAVSGVVAEAGIGNGIATVFVVGSTAGITTLEFEPGVVADLDRAFEQIAARRADYQHHLRWGDDNGSSHVREAMLGPSITIPIMHRRLGLGTWQQVVLVEFDTGPRRRTVVVQLLGE